MKTNNYFFAVILAYIFVTNANAYDFYVETSDFGGGVSIIEDVVSLNSPEITNDVQATKKINDTEVLIKSNLNKNSSEDKRQEGDLSYSNSCSNISKKNEVILNDKLISELNYAGFSDKSLDQAENFWHNQSEIKSLDNCGKVVRKLLFERAFLLNKIIKKNEYIKPKQHSLYPRINFLELTDIENKQLNDKIYSQEYIIGMYKEVKLLRKNLIKSSNGKIMLDYYFESIKKSPEKLNKKKLEFAKEYLASKINYQLYKSTTIYISDLKTKTISNRDKLIQYDLEAYMVFLNDVKPIIDYYLLKVKNSNGKIAYDASQNTLNNVYSKTSSAFLINELSLALNNL